MGGKIDCYIDIASFFSYVGLEDLLPNLKLLKAHGVEVEFWPVFLGGINNLSGNQPPWKVEAKAKYLKYDTPRATDRVGLVGKATPPDLMTWSRLTSALRALHFIKANFPAEAYIAAFRHLYSEFWTPPNTDLRDDGNLRAALLRASWGRDGSGERIFTEADVGRIMEARDSMKQALTDKTGEAVARGAFGAPWMWATNDRGESQPFFGSDRFNHIYRFLAIPFQDITILPAGRESKL